MNLLYVLEAWWWPFTTQGWGNWDVDLSEQKNGFMFVNIFDSAVARTLGDVGKPVCHIYAGLMAGFLVALSINPLTALKFSAILWVKPIVNFCWENKIASMRQHFGKTRGRGLKIFRKN